jgi:hypothetical protein
MNYDMILINPSYRKVYGFKEDISSKLPPLGLMYLSSYLKQKRYSGKKEMINTIKRLRGVLK